MPCASSLLQQVLPARDTAGLRQEFIAPTFLGSFGWISLLNPFLPAAPRPSSLLSSFHPPAYFPSSSPRRFREQARHQIVTMIIGQDIRRDDVERADDNDVVDESDGFRVRIEAFFGCPGGDLADRQQIEVIFRARKRPSQF